MDWRTLRGMGQRLLDAAVFTGLIAIAGGAIWWAPWFGIPVTVVGVLLAMKYLTRRAPAGP
jgi:hypothetical protein